MSAIGFVYILTNPYMPDVYKVGCTERSPHERAAELSKGTGVPAPFDVLCYMEVPDFQQVEQTLHAWLQHFRISESREFFEGGLEHAVAWMWHHPKRHAFCAVPDSQAYGETLLVRDEFAGTGITEFNNLPSPFAAKETSPPIPTNPLDDIGDCPWETRPELKVIEGGAS